MIDLETRRLMRELHNKPKDSSIIMHIHDARISSRLAYGHPDRKEGHVANARKVGTRQESYRKTYVGVSLEAKAISGNKDRLFKDQEEAKCVVGMLCTVDNVHHR
jgi:hypothetical protein